MQLRETHNDKQWFVPANVAVAGLTAEQASWKDGKGNHSVGQLAYHLVFWNTRALAVLKHEPVEKFSGNNEETFDNFDAKQWDTLVKKLDQVMIDCEKAVESAENATFAKWAPPSGASRCTTRITSAKWSWRVKSRARGIRRRG
jgi:DinB superfamily